MGWNRSDGAAKPCKGGGKRPAAWRGLIAALVVVAGAGVAAWLMLGRSNPPREAATDEARKPGRIAEAKPSMAATPPAAKPKAEKKVLTREEKLARIRARYGDNIPENLKATVYFLENPPAQTYEPAKTKSDIFKHPSERVIASMLRIEPGDFILQKRTLDENFDRDLAAAMEEPIEFSDADTEEERSLKQAVIETKSELAKRAAAGEKPSDILNDVTDNLYDLGRYKRELQMQISKYRLDANYSDQDVADFVTAANEMLRRKGASELPMPNFLLRQVSLKMAAKRAAAKSKE